VKSSGIVDMDDGAPPLCEESEERRHPSVVPFSCDFRYVGPRRLVTQKLLDVVKRVMRQQLDGKAGCDCLPRLSGRRRLCKAAQTTAPTAVRMMEVQPRESSTSVSHA
jgi:hypothetical protein